MVKLFENQTKENKVCLFVDGKSKNRNNKRGNEYNGWIYYRKQEYNWKEVKH